MRKFRPYDIIYGNADLLVFQVEKNTSEGLHYLGSAKQEIGALEQSQSVLSQAVLFPK